MYKNGMSIKEISTDRNLAPSTIESHLALGIRSGDLDIKSFIDDEKLNKAVAYFEGVEDKSFGIARGKLGDDFSYGELRMVTCYLEWVKVESVKMNVRRRGSVADVRNELDVRCAL